MFDSPAPMPVYVNGRESWMCAQCQSQITEIKDIYVLNVAEAWHTSCQTHSDLTITIVCMACKEAES